MPCHNCCKKGGLGNSFCGCGFLLNLGSVGVSYLSWKCCGVGVCGVVEEIPVVHGSAS